MSTAAAVRHKEPFPVGTILAVEHLRKLGSRVGALRAVHLLGGADVFGGNLKGLREYDPLLWNTVIESGLPLKALDALMQSFHIAQKPLLESIGVNVRSLQRKRKSPNATLDHETAARAVALAHLVEKAIDVMGSPEAADQWLAAPNQALGGAKPLELAGRPMGNQAALDVLNAVYHGMFS